MEKSGILLEYVTGWIQLVGLVVIVLGGLVPKLGGSRIAQKNQRTLVTGLLVLGGLVVVGGIVLELVRSNPSNLVTGNVITGDGNATGVGNTINSALDPEPQSGEVVGNRVSGDQNAVGVGNRVNQPLDAGR